ncbi:M20 family metallopeptidase [Lysinibacter sp. HNR]|uniref:M20 family metallopeptidase n=1 Tax=Lysinibacter sp. HNR TaxID=3031408 RepID=UPI002434D616|nr:M20 family metallopeptidase [Lysinibacter sp. HNR]WGD37438.1 M20 family metallopeptidase [Lysinibacter sp. HNR]
MSHTVEEAVEEQRAALLQLSHSIHAEPEIGFEEHRAVRRVADYLAQHGIDSTIGGYGLATSLEARVGEGGPVVAFLAEYDALPDIGHACGHNVICAASVGAFVALASRIREIGGTAVLLGTPAEENGTGKEIMARAGAFNGVDAALMIHPHGGPDITETAFLGLREVEVTFRGRSAHASAVPHLALNALDGVVAAYQGVAALRQHILPSDRVHGIITHGGESPNVIPAHASAHFYVRSASLERLADISRRVQQIVDGAAAMSNTAAEVRWDANPPCVPVRFNRALGERFISHLGARGRTVHRDDPREDASTGSTDLGNVSVRVPSIHPMVGIATGAGIHTQDFANKAVSAEADRAVIDSAITLAHTAEEYLVSEELRVQVRAEFEADGGVVDLEQLFA